MLALAIIVGYILVGWAVGGGVNHIRKFDRERANITNNGYYRRGGKFDHDDFDSFLALFAGIAWPIFGLPSLIWHLIEVGWSREQRKLVKELSQKSPDRYTRELREAVEERRKQQQAALDAEFQKIEREALS